MALTRIADYYPDYKDRVFGGEDVIGYSVYNDMDEKIGDVRDILLDEEGRFRYFVIDTGFWIFGKQVMLPVGRTRMDFGRNRVYAIGLTRQQVESLPEYRHEERMDFDHEEQVRNVYRPGLGGVGSAATGEAAAVGATAPVERATPRAAYSREDYHYDREPELYAMNEQDHQNLKLYQERLIANKNRVKTGEVAVGKHVETQTAQVAVPIEKERVIIERKDVSDRTAVTPGEASFESGEVARMEVYEESANIQKEAFVREEVSVRKEVEHDTVQAEEQIRREELDIDVEGKPNVNRGANRGVNDRDINRGVDRV